MLKYLARIAAIIFFLLGLVGSVYLVRIVYGAYQQSDMNKDWVQIPSPDEPLFTLRVGDNGEVFAEGEYGGLYQFVISPEPAWVNTQDTENIYSNPQCRALSSESSHQVKTKSGRIKSQVSVDCGFAEQAIYWDVDLLENGETWFFESASNSYAVIGLFLLVPIGVIIDGALYVICLFFLALDIIITFRRKAKQAA